MSPAAALHSVACVAHTDEDVGLTVEAVERALSAR